MDDASQARVRVRTGERVAGRRRLWGGTWRLMLLPMLVFIVLPLAALITRTTPQAIWSHLLMPPVQQAIRLSLLTSLVTVALAVIFGLPVAYYLAHSHYRFHRLIDTLVDLPTVLPPAVAGLALLMAFGRRGLLGGWLDAFGVQLPFSAAAVVLAQLFVSAPLFIRAATVGLNAVDCELLKAAALDGASRWQSFRYIMLPMASLPLISGCLLTWARALGEFGATIIFAGNLPGRTQTMPLAIYLGFELDLDLALTLSVILVGLSFTTLLLVKAIFYKQWME